MVLRFHTGHAASAFTSVLTGLGSNDIFGLANMYQEIFKRHADLLKALSHPKRLEIVNLLREQELAVSEVKRMLDLPQANLSQHLEVLRQAEVVKARRDGKYIYYSLAHKNFVKASDLLRAVLVERHRDSVLADEFTKSMSDLVPLVHDPVCGMRLSPKTAGFACKYRKNDYYFCASGCWREFKKIPNKFLKSREEEKV